MESYLIVVDATYPARAKELLNISKSLSRKLVRYVFDMPAHDDHYGNSVWTAAGATTMAFRGVVTRMDRWEPARWQTAMAKRDDVRMFEYRRSRCSDRRRLLTTIGLC
jgi:cyclase